MKKFNLEIKNPCDANLDQMQTTSNGFYCNSCAKNVIDLSKKTNAEVAKFISEVKDKNNICARLHYTQLQEEFTLAEHEKKSNLKHAVAVAATVLLTTQMVAQEKQVVTKHETAITKPHVIGKIAYQKPADKTITFTINGKLLDAKTHKPFSKAYSNLMILFNGTSNPVKVNPKTGKFTTTITLNENAKELQIDINGNEMGLSKKMPINLKTIQKNTLLYDIIIDPAEFMHYKIAGGLGVIIIDDKKNKTIS